MLTKLIELTRRGPKTLSTTMYAVPSFGVHGQLDSVNVHFDTPGTPGKYILELDAEAVRYLSNELSKAHRQDVGRKPPPRRH